MCCRDSVHLSPAAVRCACPRAQAAQAYACLHAREFQARSHTSCRARAETALPALGQLDVSHIARDPAGCSLVAFIMRRRRFIRGRFSKFDRQEHQQPSADGLVVCASCPALPRSRARRSACSQLPRLQRCASLRTAHSVMHTEWPPSTDHVHDNNVSVCYM